MIVPGGGGEFLLPLSRVPGGMVMDKIDTCIGGPSRRISHGPITCSRFVKKNFSAGATAIKHGHCYDVCKHSVTQSNYD